MKDLRLLLACILGTIFLVDITLFGMQATLCYTALVLQVAGFMYIITTYGKYAVVASVGLVVCVVVVGYSMGITFLFMLGVNTVLTQTAKVMILDKKGVVV